MRREIEFRAITQENKIIQDIGCIEFFEDGTIIVNGEVPIKQLIQFTGCLDKNGTKIFEGDRVIYQGMKGEIRWRYFRWHFYNGAGYCGDTIKAQDFEVIGNIWENPEGKECH